MQLVGDRRFAGRLLGPSADSYETLTNKARMVELAAELEIPHPETIIVTSLREAHEAVGRVGLPIVIKPSRSRYLSANTIRSTAVAIVQTPSAALEHLNSCNWFPGIPALIQRYVPGTGAGVFTLFWRGRPVCWFAHRRLLERPPWGGVSVLCESVAVDPVLQELSLRLLNHVQWSGLAMIEFRVTPGGSAYLMEVNGRPWGSMQLAIDCGVDFPWLLYCCAQGIPFDAPATYEQGRRLHWTLGDLDRLLIQLRGRADSGQRAGRLREIAAFVGRTFRYAHRSEVFRISDPLPGVFEVKRWLADAIGLNRPDGRGPLADQ